MKQNVKPMTTIFRRKKDLTYFNLLNLKSVNIRSLVRSKHPEVRTLKILEGELLTLEKVTDSVISDLIYLIERIESQKIAHKVLDFLLKKDYLSVENLSQLARARCEVSVAEKVQEALFMHKDISNYDL